LYKSIKLNIIFYFVFVFLGLGDSSCRYSGNFDSGNEICHKDVVKIDTLPCECTAFVFDGVICNTVYDIVYRWIPEDLGNNKFIINISRYLVLFKSHYNFYN